MFENPTIGRQARNFTANVPKISRSQIVFRRDIFQKLTLGAPGTGASVENKLDEQTVMFIVAVNQDNYKRESSRIL